MTIFNRITNLTTGLRAANRLAEREAQLGLLPSEDLLPSIHAAKAHRAAMASATTAMGRARAYVAAGVTDAEVISARLAATGVHLPAGIIRFELGL